MPPRVLVTLLARRPVVARGFLAPGPMTAPAYLVITGLIRGSDPFTKVRLLALESRAGVCLTALAVIVFFVSELFVLGLRWAWLAFGTLGVIVAAALHFDIDREVEAERRGAVEQAKAMTWVEASFGGPSEGTERGALARRSRSAAWSRRGST